MLSDNVIVPKYAKYVQHFFNEMTLSMFVLSFIPLAPSVLSLSLYVSIW